MDKNSIIQKSKANTFEAYDCDLQEHHQYEPHAWHNSKRIQVASWIQLPCFSNSLDSLSTKHNNDVYHMHICPYACYIS